MIFPKDWGFLERAFLTSLTCYSKAFSLLFFVYFFSTLFLAFVTWRFALFSDPFFLFPLNTRFQFNFFCLFFPLVSAFVCTRWTFTFESLSTLFGFLLCLTDFQQLKNHPLFAPRPHQSARCPIYTRRRRTKYTLSPCTECRVAQLPVVWRDYYSMGPPTGNTYSEQA